MGAFDYDERFFTPVSNSATGEVGSETVFHYRQRGEVVARLDGRLISRQGSPIHVAHGNALKDDLTLAEAVTFLARLHGLLQAPDGFALEVRGKQGHSSGIFSERAGYGAVLSAARSQGARRRAGRPRGGARSK